MTQAILPNNFGRIGKAFSSMTSLWQNSTLAKCNRDSLDNSSWSISHTFTVFLSVGYDTIGLRNALGDANWNFNLSAFDKAGKLSVDIQSEVKANQK